MKRRNLLKNLTALSLVPFFAQKSLGNPLIEDCPTTSDIQGPFYTPGAPVRTTISPVGAAGTVLFLTGTVYRDNCQTPIPFANLDAWQADDGGAYDNVGFNYRGKFQCNETGNYSMQTILPGKYLNGADFRPRHIHFKIHGAGSPVLTTQLYFDGDTHIPSDPWASNPSAADRIIPLTPDASGVMHGVFDISLDIAVGVGDALVYPDRAFIENIFPNPITENGSVSVSLPKRSNIALTIYNVNGSLVKNIYSGSLNQGTHEIAFNRLNDVDLALCSAVYILQLSIDGKTVDAKRMMVR